MKIRWTDPAIEDLRALHDYIARDAPFYADQFIDRIISTVDNLHKFPEMGRTVPEADRPDIRELLCQKYRIIYHLQSECLTILTVIHGSRDLSGSAPKPWEPV